MTLRSSFGSFGTSRIFSSSEMRSLRTLRSLSSSSARSRISGSPPLISSSALVISSTTVLYSRYFCTSGSISARALACLRYSLASLCTCWVPSDAISSSYLASVEAILSNIDQLSVSTSRRHGRQKRDLVAVRHRGRKARIVGVDRARDRFLVRRQLRVIRDQRRPHRADVGAGRRFARQLAAAGDVAQPREQPDGYAHAILSASSRASALSGSAVAPSIHTSPPSKYSCFQIGTICLMRSIA